MQHTSEAQQAALQSYYMGTGALTHTHSHKQTTTTHLRTEETHTHAGAHYRNVPLCVVAAEKTGLSASWMCYC